MDAGEGSGSGAGELGPNVVISGVNEGSWKGVRAASVDEEEGSGSVVITADSFGGEFGVGDEDSREGLGTSEISGVVKLSGTSGFASSVSVNGAEREAEASSRSLALWAAVILRVTLRGVVAALVEV